MLSHELTSIPVSVNEIFESIGIGAGIASSKKSVVTSPWQKIYVMLNF